MCTRFAQLHVPLLSDLLTWPDPTLILWPCPSDLVTLGKIIPAFDLKGFKLNVWHIWLHSLQVSHTYKTRNKLAHTQCIAKQLEPYRAHTQHIASASTSICIEMRAAAAVCVHVADVCTWPAVGRVDKMQCLWALPNIMKPVFRRL